MYTNNVKKTELLRFGLPRDGSSGLRLIGKDLKRFNYFRCLGNNIFANCNLNDETHNCIAQVSAFGRPNRQVFTNLNLTVKTRIMVHQAVYISCSLCCCESWTLYRKRIKLPPFCYAKKNRTHGSVPYRTSCVLLKSLICRNQLR